VAGTIVGANIKYLYLWTTISLNKIVFVLDGGIYRINLDLIFSKDGEQKIFQYSNEIFPKTD
jgi:hypothetical protein